MEAVQEAISQYGCPKIFNPDQGCQFISQEFTVLLKDHGIRVSMDGAGRWRSLVYGKVYLHTYGPLREVQQGIVRYPTFYNQVMPHYALESHTLEDVYDEHQSTLHATE